MMVMVVAAQVGQTALLLAVSGSLRATSKLLIECGADVRAKNSVGGFTV